MLSATAAADQRKASVVKQRRHSKMQGTIDTADRQLNRIADELGRMRDDDEGQPAAAPGADSSDEELAPADECIRELLAACSEDEEFLWLQDVAEHLSTAPGASAVGRCVDADAREIFGFFSNKLASTRHAAIAEIILAILNRMLSPATSLRRDTLAELVGSDLVIQALNVKNQAVVAKACSVASALCRANPPSAAAMVEQGVLERVLGLISSSHASQAGIAVQRDPKQNLLPALVSCAAAFGVCHPPSARLFATRKPVLRVLLHAASDAEAATTEFLDDLSSIFASIGLHADLLPAALACNCATIAKLACFSPAPARTDRVLRLLADVADACRRNAHENDVSDLRESAELQVIAGGLFGVFAARQGGAYRGETRSIVEREVDGPSAGLHGGERVGHPKKGAAEPAWAAAAPALCAFARAVVVSERPGAAASRNEAAFGAETIRLVTGGLLALLARHCCCAPASDPAGGAQGGSPPARPPVPPLGPEATGTAATGEAPSGTAAAGESDAFRLDEPAVTDLVLALRELTQRPELLPDDIRRVSFGAQSVAWLMVEYATGTPASNTPTTRRTLILGLYSILHNLTRSLDAMAAVDYFSAVRTALRKLLEARRRRDPGAAPPACEDPDPQQASSITEAEMLWVTGAEHSLTHASRLIHAVVKIQARYRGSKARKFVDALRSGDAFVVMKSTHFLADFRLAADETELEAFSLRRELVAAFEEGWKAVRDNARRLAFFRMELAREVDARHHAARQQLLLGHEDTRGGVVAREREMLAALKELHQAELAEVDANIEDARLLSVDEQNVVVTALVERRERLVKQHARARIDLRNAEASQRDKLAATSAAQLSNLEQDQANSTPFETVAAEEERARGLGPAARRAWWHVDSSVTGRETSARNVLTASISVSHVQLVEAADRSRTQASEAAGFNQVWVDHVRSIFDHQSAQLCKQEAASRCELQSGYDEETSAIAVPSHEYVKRWLSACRHVSSWMQRAEVDCQELGHRVVLEEWEGRAYTETAAFAAIIQTRMRAHLTAAAGVLPMEESSRRRAMHTSWSDEREVLDLVWAELEARGAVVDERRTSLERKMQLFFGVDVVIDKESDERATLTAAAAGQFEAAALSFHAIRSCIDDVTPLAARHLPAMALVLGTGRSVHACAARGATGGACGYSHPGLRLLVNYGSPVVYSLTAAAAAVVVAAQTAASHTPVRAAVVRRRYASNSFADRVRSAAASAMHARLVFRRWAGMPAGAPQACLEVVCVGPADLSVDVSDFPLGGCCITRVRAGAYTYHVVAGQAAAVFAFVAAVRDMLAAQTPLGSGRFSILTVCARGPADPPRPKLLHYDADDIVAASEDGTQSTKTLVSDALSAAARAQLAVCGGTGVTGKTTASSLHANDGAAVRSTRAVAGEQPVDAAPLYLVVSVLPDPRSPPSDALRCAQISRCVSAVHSAVQTCGGVVCGVADCVVAAALSFGDLRRVRSKEMLFAALRRIAVEMAGAGLSCRAAVCRGKDNLAVSLRQVLFANAGMFAGHECCDGEAWISILEKEGGSAHGEGLRILCRVPTSESLQSGVLMVHGSVPLDSEGVSPTHWTATDVFAGIEDAGLHVSRAVCGALDTIAANEDCDTPAIHFACSVSNPLSSSRIRVTYTTTGRPARDCAFSDAVQIATFCSENPSTPAIVVAEGTRHAVEQWAASVPLSLQRVAVQNTGGAKVKPPGSAFHGACRVPASVLSAIDGTAALGLLDAVPYSMAVDLPLGGTEVLNEYAACVVAVNGPDAEVERVVCEWAPEVALPFGSVRLLVFDVERCFEVITRALQLPPYCRVGIARGTASCGRLGAAASSAFTCVGATVATAIALSAGASRVLVSKPALDAAVSQSHPGSTPNPKIVAEYVPHLRHIADAFTVTDIVYDDAIDVVHNETTLSVHSDPPLSTEPVQNATPPLARKSSNQQPEETPLDYRRDESTAPSDDPLASAEDDVPESDVIREGPATPDSLKRAVETEPVLCRRGDNEDVSIADTGDTSDDQEMAEQHSDLAESYASNRSDANEAIAAEHDKRMLEFLTHRGIGLLLQVPKIGMARMRGLSVLQSIAALQQPTAPLRERAVGISNPKKKPPPAAVLPRQAKVDEPSTRRAVQPAGSRRKVKAKASPDEPRLPAKKPAVRRKPERFKMLIHLLENSRQKVNT
eukprot:gene3232-5060_t